MLVDDHAVVRGGLGALLLAFYDLTAAAIGQPTPVGSRWRPRRR